MLFRSMSDVELPLSALRVQLASAVNIIVQTSRLADGSRKITHVSEVRGYDATDGFRLVDLYLRKFQGRDGHGNLVSTLEPTGELPLCTEMVHSYGMQFPASLYEAARARQEMGGAEAWSQHHGGGHH